MAKKKILLVEDDDLIRELYVRQFNKAGYDTEGVAKGKQGLDEALKNNYDLILLDIMLPDTNGLEILKKVKQTDKTKNTKVVILSNLGQDEVVKEGLALGAESYLIKASYTPDQVIKEVSDLIEGKK